MFVAYIKHTVPMCVISQEVLVNLMPLRASLSLIWDFSDWSCSSSPHVTVDESAPAEGDWSVVPSPGGWSIENLYTIDHEIFVIKNFSPTTFSDKNKIRKILVCNVCRPIPILVAKVWWWNLDYIKNLQAKYFTSESIPIYSTTNLINKLHGPAVFLQCIHM